MIKYRYTILIQWTVTVSIINLYAHSLNWEKMR